MIRLVYGTDVKNPSSSRPVRSYLIDDKLILIGEHVEQIRPQLFLLHSCVRIEDFYAALVFLQGTAMHSVCRQVIHLREDIRPAVSVNTEAFAV